MFAVSSGLAPRGGGLPSLRRRALGARAAHAGSRAPAVARALAAPCCTRKPGRRLSARAWWQVLIAKPGVEGGGAGGADGGGGGGGELLIVRVDNDVQELAVMTPDSQRLRDALPGILRAM